MYIMNHKTEPTTSGRQARRQTQLWQRLMLTAAMLLVFTLGANARANWENTDHFFKAYFDNNNGYFTIEILQGDNEFGPANENGYIEDATLKYGNRSLVKITANDVNDDLTTTILNNSDGNITISKEWRNDRYYYIVITWTPNFVPTAENMTLTGTWDVNGAYETDPINGEKRCEPKAAPSITFSEATVNSATNTTTVKFSAGDHSGMFQNGKYQLYRGNNVVAEIQANKISQTGTFTLNEIIESPSTYQIRFE